MLILGSGGVLAQVPDTNTLREAGIRTLKSRHLTLYTDLPSSPDVDDLAKVFDLAISQWAQFFNAQPAALDNWHVVACVMQDAQRFEDYRLLPQDLPPFLHGLQRGDRIWVREQPSAYYRRHLLLHEGTHAVMNRIFGRVGPAWYREGIAEMLATHSYRDGKLKLDVFPQDRSDVEYWGRIKIVRADVEKNGVRQINQIVDLPTRAFLSSDAYAWSWALQAFLHRRTKYAELCQSLLTEMGNSDRSVTKAFLRGFQRQRADLDYDWNLFVRHLDYGYDSSHETITPAKKVDDLEDDRIRTVLVDVTKAWQAAGLRVAASDSIELAALGRFQVARESPPGKPAVAWMCEPQGITLEYYQGRPLGQLLAAIVPEDASSSDSRFDAVSVGRMGKMSTKTGGQLYLRINERSDRLGDNSGQITVKIRRATPN